MLAAHSSLRDHDDAHLWTERYDAWIAREQRAAHQLDRLFRFRTHRLFRRRFAPQQRRRPPPASMLWRCRRRGPDRTPQASVATRKGALDVLDDLKLGLLSGNLDASTVNRLRDARLI